MKVLLNSQDKVYLSNSDKVLKAPEKCGMTISNFVGDIDSNGVLQRADFSTNADFTGVEDIAAYALDYAFTGAGKNITAVSFPDLTEISGNYAMNYAFYKNTNISSISFPELVEVSGQYGMYYAFQGCTSISSVSFSELTTVSGNNAMYYTFQGSNGITSVSLPK